MSLMSIVARSDAAAGTQVLAPNEETLLVYENNAQEYLNNTPYSYRNGHEPLIKWIDTTLAQAPGKEVFEIGSGHGRDARYIKDKKYNILCSDATVAFVNYLNTNNQRAVYFNVLQDEMPKAYDAIFANSVIPHFTTEDLNICLTKIYESLNPDGVLAITAKQGKGEAWVNEKLTAKRYIHYWQPDSLIRKLRSTGFEVTYLDDGIPGGDIPSHTWIHVVAKKT